MRRVVQELRAFTSRLVSAPEPPALHGPYATEGAAERREKQLNLRWSGHLDAYDGFFATERREDGFWVVEHRGRRTPRKRWLSNLLTYTPGP